MNRKKLTILLGMLSVVAAVIWPVRAKHGERPVMSHAELSQYEEEITDLLEGYADQQMTLGSQMVEVRVDQLTGFNGYSLLGVECLFGRRSTNTVGYIAENDAGQLFSGGDAVWVGVDELDVLREIARTSEQE